MSIYARAGWAEKDHIHNEWNVLTPRDGLQPQDVHSFKTRKEAYDYLFAWRIMHGIKVRRRVK